MSADRFVVTADAAFDETGTAFDAAVLVEDGVIVARGADARASDAPQVKLGNRMLLPGFISAHSHAFQRALRGRVEHKSADRPNDDFWAWRSTMYSDAQQLTESEIESIAAWCFLDMVRAGYTAVGEFHYLHRTGDDTGADDLGTARAVARAAARVGIRLTLLDVAYGRAGANKPPLPEQRRFTFQNVDDFLAHARATADALTPSGVVHGLAVHSVRACARDWIEAVAAEATRSGEPLHMHACEQPAEVETCRAEHGMAPLALLSASGALRAGSTVVHATHIDDAELAILGKSGAAVCICGTTERNLGDGLVRAKDIADRGVSLCIGTDSQVRIDVPAELRAVEDGERLRVRKRNVLVPAGGRLAQALMPMGTVNGARAIGQPAGFVVGGPADFVAVDIPLEGRAGSAADGLDAWLVGGSSRDVSDVWIGGKRVVQDRLASRVSTYDIEGAALDVLRRIAVK